MARVGCFAAETVAFLEVNSGPKMPPTPWFWPHPQSQRAGGVPRRPGHMNPELGFVVIKIWLKREILTAALRPATWDSPRAPGNDPGERLGKGASVVTNRLAARGTHRQADGAEEKQPVPLGARNTLACFEWQTPRRQSGQNTYMMWAKFTLDRFWWLPGQKKPAGGLVRFPPSNCPHPASPPTPPAARASS